MDRMHLTKSEEELMGVLWQADKPLSKSEIVARAYNRSWRVSYIHSLLNSLMHKGLIKIAGEITVRRRPARLYMPALSPEEYGLIEMTDFPVYQAGTVKQIIKKLYSRLNERDRQCLLKELRHMKSETGGGSERQ